MIFLPAFCQVFHLAHQLSHPETSTLPGNLELRPSDVDNIGYLPEERGLYKKMKVGEQAVYLATLKGLSKHDALKKLKYWFEKFSIEDWWDKKVEELSKTILQIKKSEIQELDKLIKK